MVDEAKPVKTFSSRLHAAIRASDTKLKGYLQSRQDILKEYVGSHYGQGGAVEKVPVDLIELAVTIYVFNIVQRNPSAQVTTPFLNRRAKAAKIQQGLEHLLSEIDFEDTMRRCVLGGLFGPGIAKCGIKPAGEVEIEGVLIDPGQPFCVSVDVSDLIVDPRAREWMRAAFIGDRYTLPYRYVMDSGQFKNTDRLTPTTPDQQSKESPERLSESRGLSSEGELEEEITVADLWLPREGMVLTVPASPSAPEVIIKEIEWHGPERGPYEFLSYHDVPENVLPLPPVFVLKDLHDVINRMVRKMTRQADRQKSIGAFTSGDEEDATRVKQANDGEIVRLSEFGTYQEMNIGGVSPVNQAYLMWTNDKFNRMAGNLDTLGGLAAQTDTVGQENLLAGQSSARARDMTYRSRRFMKRNLEKLAWYLFYDPLIELPMTKQVPGTNIVVETALTPEDMEGEVLEYDFDIVAYSAEDPTPASIVRSLQEFMQGILMPMLQMGAGPDALWPIARLYARYMHISDSDLNDIMVSVGAMPSPEERTQMGGPSHERTMPTQTTRTNIRRSVPTGEAGVNAAVMQSLMASASGAPPQPQGEA